MKYGSVSPPDSTPKSRHPHKEKSLSMLRKIVSIGLIQSVGIVINMVRSKIFAVLLGPAGFGVVATIDQLVMSVVQISNLSLPFTALKFLSHSHSLDDDSFRRTYSAFFKVMALLAIIAMLVTLIAISVNLERFNSQLAPYREPVTIALFGIPATMMLMFFVNVLAARQQSIQSVMLTVLSTAVILAAGTLGYLIGGINGIYIATVMASTILMLAVAVFFRSQMKLLIWFKDSNIWSELFAKPKFIGITIWVYLAVASAAIQLFLARYAAITHVSAEAAGLLQACLAVSLSIGAVLGPASSLYFTPYVNRNISATDKIAAADRFLPRLVLLYCLGGLAVLLFPELVLTILYSEKFSPATSILPWFVAWQCVYLISNVYQQLLIGLDDAWGYAVVTAIGNLLAAALCMFLVGRYALLGIAIGFVSGALITALLTAIRLRSKHNIAIPKSVPALMIFAIVGFSGIVVIGHATAELTWIGLGARAATAGIFLTVLWFILPGTLRMELRAGVSAKLPTWVR